MNLDKIEKEQEEEFIELYNKWHSSYMFSAFGSADPRAKVHYYNLIEWCKKHHDAALQYIKEILLKEPNDVVRILDNIYKEEYNFSIEGCYQFDEYCNLWLNALHNNNVIKDYYEDYKKWKEYLGENYISWNPILENDPNVTLEEFKQGKRNKII